MLVLTALKLWDLPTSYTPKFEEVTYISFFLLYNFPTVAYFNKRQLKKKSKIGFLEKQASQPLSVFLSLTMD